MIFRDPFVEIRLQKTSKKTWCQVRTLRSDHTFLPSFEQLHAVIQQLVHCERLAYPEGGKGGRDPGWMVGEFCKRAAGGQEYEALRSLFQLPDKAATQTPPATTDPDLARWTADLSRRISSH